MSDISIPGVSSKIDTEKIIQALLGPERFKIEAKKKEIDGLSAQKKAWQEINRNLKLVQDAAKKLFGFETPFRDKTVISSNETVLIANATREAQLSQHKITVKQTAQADKFKTASLNKDYKVPAGTYTFQVGENQISIKFKGGSLEEFADAINKKADKFLKASVVKDSANTKVLILESKITGKDNRLLLKDAALDFGLASGMLEKSLVIDREIAVNKSTVSNWKKDGSALRAGDSSVTLLPFGEFKLDVNPPIPANQDLVIEIEYEVKHTDKTAAKDKPTGPAIPSSGYAEFEGIRVENDPSDVTLPGTKLDDTTKTVSDDTVFFLDPEGKTSAKIDRTEGKHTLTLKAGSDLKNIDSLYARNNNSDLEITVTRVRIYDPNATEGLKPKNAISRAQDAIVELDGIEVVRSSNDIDDLIPGVKLKLLSVSKEAVDLKIDTDVEKIKNAIIEFVGYYNQLLAKIDIYSRIDTSIIDDLAYLSPDERAQAEKDLGLLQGDLTLNQIKNGLRSLAANSYTTGFDIALLSQIGIATDAGKPAGAGSAIDRSRLRGYLEIDEKKLESALRENIQAVQALFGMDRDSDFVVDSGAAYAVEAFIRPYVMIGGVIATKLSTYDTTIARREKDVASMTEKLAAYEAELRYKYGQMEGALGQMEESKKAIENLDKSGK